MTRLHEGQGPVTPAMAAGTVSCTAQEGQENVNESVTVFQSA